MAKTYTISCSQLSSLNGYDLGLLRMRQSLGTLERHGQGTPTREPASGGKS